MAVGISTTSNLSDLDKKEYDGRDSPQEIAPHTRRGVVGVVGAHEL